MPEKPENPPGASPRRPSTISKLELPREREERDRERAAQIKSLREELEDQLSRSLSLEVEPSRRGGGAQQDVPPGPLSDEEGKRVLEAVLFSSPKPLSRPELARILNGARASTLDRWAKELAAEYAATARSFKLREVAGGYEISTEPEFAPWLMKLEREKRIKQATQSALESLAIIAYKQPCTRAEIEDLRGVNVSGVLSTLLARGLIHVAGKKEVAGRPLLYATTPVFLEHFGLKSLADLPKIEEIRELVEKSIGRDTIFRKEILVDAPPAQEEIHEPQGS